MIKSHENNAFLFCDRSINRETIDLAISRIQKENKTKQKISTKECI